MMQFKNLPVEIQEKMLDEQVQQGNPRNAEMFEKDVTAGLIEGGFTWEQSVEGHNFWEKIILYGSLATFYEKYPKS